MGYLLKKIPRMQIGIDISPFSFKVESTKLALMAVIIQPVEHILKKKVAIVS